MKFFTQIAVNLTKKAETGDADEVEQVSPPQPDTRLPARRDAVSEAKRLGLPATGPTGKIADLVRIAKTPTSQWTRTDFDTIKYHLSIHHVYPRGVTLGDIRQGIEREGLKGGMVDNLGNIIDKRWSWARGVKGPAYIFLSGELKWRGDSGRVQGSGKPLAYIPEGIALDAGDVDAIYEAVRNGSLT
jgi:hypothetical protein